MSYKTNVIVVRFTELDAKNFKTTQTIVDTRAKAREEAVKIAEQEIAGNEKVTGLRLTDETGAGWIYSVTIDDKYPRS
jgi:uncharacterized membrane protein YkoI